MEKTFLRERKALHSASSQNRKLKNQLRKIEPDFSEKRYGFSGFLQFCKAARTRGIIDYHWDDDADDYVVNLGG